MENVCLNCLRPSADRYTCPHCGVSPGDVPQAPGCLKPGTILKDAYLVGRLLGQGGFAKTYLGMHLLFHDQVAIKEYFPSELAERDGATGHILPRTSSDPSRDLEVLFHRGLDEFHREGQNIRKCHRPNTHPNIVHATDAFLANGTAYLVMDYIEGESLENYLRRQPGNRLEEQDALSIIGQVFTGLAHIHDKGFLHRDVKPANIYLGASGRAILLDFGAARQVLGESTQTLTVVLTQGYAPREQYTKKGEQGPWTDVYAAGATLYRCLAGRPPVNVLERVASCEPLPHPITINNAISPRVSAAIMWALAIEPEGRPASVQEFARALTDPKYPIPAQEETVARPLLSRAALEQRTYRPDAMTEPTPAQPLPGTELPGTAQQTAPTADPDTGGLVAGLREENPRRPAAPQIDDFMEAGGAPAPPQARIWPDGVNWIDELLDSSDPEERTPPTRRGRRMTFLAILIIGLLAAIAAFHDKIPMDKVNEYWNSSIGWAKSYITVSKLDDKTPPENANLDDKPPLSPIEPPPTPTPPPQPPVAPPPTPPVEQPPVVTEPPSPPVEQPVAPPPTAPVDTAPPVVNPPVPEQPPAPVDTAPPVSTAPASVDTPPTDTGTLTEPDTEIATDTPVIPLIEIESLEVEPEKEKPPVVIDMASLEAPGEAPSTPVPSLRPISMKLPAIPAGKFMMGTSLEPEVIAQRYGGKMSQYISEIPTREVTISRPFLIFPKEVTNQEFNTFVALTGYVTSAENDGGAYRWDKRRENLERVAGLNWKNPGWEPKPDLPVVAISYNDAKAYCEWFNKSPVLQGKCRLPKESEWEYACRAGSTAEFSWGDDAKGGADYLNGADLTFSPDGDVREGMTFVFKDKYWGPAPVGSFKTNTWGLHDMHGNVAEICEEKYIKGGGFSSPPGECRAAYRETIGAAEARVDVGFRLVCVDGG